MTKRLANFIKGTVTTIIVTVILLFSVNHDLLIVPILEILTESFENLGFDHRTADDIAGILVLYGIVMACRGVMKLVFKLKIRISLKKEEEAEVSE